VGIAERLVNNQLRHRSTEMNETPRSVRNAHTASEVTASSGDRRIRRTRQALTDALVEVALEKRYEAMTVQDLLDRADVGRSTFYAHYRGKDDLLLRSFERMLWMLDASMDGNGTGHTRLFPVRELFQHVGASRQFHGAVAQARMLDRLYHAATECLTTMIGKRIAARGDRQPGAAPAVLAARAAAGSLVALLRWWVDQESAEAPELMDEAYHALVLPGVLGVEP
jgi:AcrR family transcriptional regulator